MYLSIIILPLLGSLISGLLGRKIGINGSQLISCSCLFLSAVISTLAFYEVGISGSPVSIKLAQWIDSEIMQVTWEFLFDQLSVVFCIMITYITFLILVYTVYYMEGQPHIQRFFSYLSAFAGFMLILVTGGNYFVLFVGWEGMSQCLKSINIFYNFTMWFNNILLRGVLCSATEGVNSLEKIIYNYIYLYKETISINAYLAVLPFLGYISNVKLNSMKRIGPHNIDVISLIIGSTLGDSHLERRKGGIGTRIVFEQSNKNVEYLMWFHNFFAVRGYCNPEKPKLHKRIKKNNVVFFHYRFNSYTYSSFNWIHDIFYSSFLDLPSCIAAPCFADQAGGGAELGALEQDKKRYIKPALLSMKEEQCKMRGVKIIPRNISEFLTPLALAIWFMDDGSKINNTVRIATNNFSFEEIEFLSTVLYNKYNLKSKPQSAGKSKGHILYFSSSSMVEFSNIVKPYMHPSMFYKLGM